MIKIIGIVLLLSLVFPLVAKDFGNEGQTFAIREMPFDVFVKARLAMLQRTGKIKAYEQAAIRRVKKDVYHPHPLPLGTRTDTKVITVDPTIRLNQTITDGAGKVLIPSGTTINPFKTLHYDTVLFFFNGDDPKQVAWVKQHYQQYHLVKFILTGGQLQKMANDFGRIYFDQNQYVARQLHITTVPAIAQQDGLKWKVTLIGSKAF